MNGIRFLTMLAGLLLTCAHVTNVAADNIQDKIKNTDQKILKEQKKIKEEQTKQRKAKQELIKTKKEINNLDQNLNRLSKRERSLLGELKALEKKERVLKSSIKEEKIRLSQLIKRTYILGYSPEAGPAIDTLSDSKVSAFYLKKIAMKRSEIIKNFNSKITEIDRLQEKKLGIRKELKKIKKDTSKQKNVAEREKLKTSSEIDGTKTRIKRSENKISENKKRLTQLFAELEKRKKDRIKNNNLPDRSLSGKPFNTLKGKLRLPALGTITSKFGQKRVGSELPWEGIFISSNQGNSVKSIAGGSVVYSDWLRGFGNLIIVDHGKGYYSLYGNNETIWAREGDQLDAGDQLGTVGNSGGHKGPGVYFEVRHNSKPLNPMEWVNIDN
ncbi:MAG: peptidoglycan DD-metalloendopeptidase family protein [Proteobacteria bacterium]|nr:peptidoglycan DD-metalloendopeptidase family protein [Pseudomonadota bacterium]MDA1011936.1 peptidoglycan DD-metalloendopeptidase family protein [Pseudomonadota bacterium]